MLTLASLPSDKEKENILFFFLMVKVTCVHCKQSNQIRQDVKVWTKKWQSLAIFPPRERGVIHQCVLFSFQNPTWPIRFAMAVPPQHLWSGPFPRWSPTRSLLFLGLCLWCSVLCNGSPNFPSIYLVHPSPWKSFESTSLACCMEPSKPYQNTGRVLWAALFNPITVSFWHYPISLRSQTVRELGWCLMLFWSLMIWWTNIRSV